MKLSRFYIAIPALLLASALSLQAQSETDAFRLSQTGLAGSARYQALAGAFTALGGDLSAIAYNPAATAVFQKKIQGLFTGFKVHNHALAVKVPLGSKAIGATQIAVVGYV